MVRANGCTGRPSASGDIKERTTAEHGPSMVRYPFAGRWPCSAVATGILGVHREVPGRFRIAPPPQSANRDQTTLFAFLQSGA